MLFLILLVAYDSLPPLPDLSQITFPEPPLWILEPEDSMRAEGNIGEFISASGNVRYGDFRVSGFYTDRFHWGEARYGTGTLSFAHGFPHLWIQPVLNGFSMKRDDEYLCITPGFTVATTNPWSVIRGMFNYSIWGINSSRAFEAMTSFDITFDQTFNKPSVLLEGMYVNGHYYQLFGGGIHIQNIHITAISPITDFFPSPCVCISSLHPSFRIMTEIRTGTVLKTLHDRFDPDVPLHYTVIAPVESLRVAARLGVVIDLYDHILEVQGFYRNWYNYALPGRDFALEETLDVREAGVSMKIHNTLDYSRLHMTHALYAHYSWQGDTVPFTPRYSIIDTLGLEYRFFSAGVALEYRTAHRGIGVDLPSVFIVDPRIGIRYRVLTLFLAVMNSTGTRRQYYDGYWMPSRAIAGGLRLKTTF